MNIDYTLIQTSNSRFLYKSSYGLAYDWPEIINSIDLLINSSKNLKLSSPFSLIYFFENPANELFVETENFIGREVIGIVPKIDEEFLAMDLDAGECFRFEYKNKLDFLPADILEFYELCIGVLKSQDVKVSTTWRIGVFEKIEDENLTMKVFFDFFPEQCI